MTKPLAPKHMPHSSLLRQVVAQPVKSIQLKFECVHCRDEFQAGSGDTSIPLCHLSLNGS